MYAFNVVCIMSSEKLNTNFKLVGTFDLMFYWRFEYQWTIKLSKFKSFVQQQQKKWNEINICSCICFWLISLNNNTFLPFLYAQIAALHTENGAYNWYYDRRLVEVLDHFRECVNMLQSHTAYEMTKSENYENATNIYVTHFKSHYHDRFHKMLYFFC